MGSSFKIILAGVVVIIAAMTSCLPNPIEVKDIAQPPKIVVSSQIIGTTFNILLTKSISALDANDESDLVQVLSKAVITDAAVTIVINGRSYPLTFKSGVYVSSEIPFLLNEPYNLYVTSRTYGSVSATTTLNKHVKFSDVKARFHIVRHDTLANISYFFNDPDGLNWYLLIGQRITNDDVEQRLLNPRVTIKTLKDSTFEGGLVAGGFDIHLENFQAYDSVSATLANVSEDYYKYIQLQENSALGVAAALGEPLNYPTNIVGGLGFFNLYIPDQRSFILNP